MITLYDMGPSYIPKELGFSPNVRKVIFTLNYKNLPYEIVNIRFDNIESTAKSIGAPPTSRGPDGLPKYTVPFIQDSNTGKVVSDSLVIAEYLDNAYPNTPRVVPEGTRVLQSVFIDAFVAKISILMPASYKKWGKLCTPEHLEAFSKVYPNRTFPQVTAEEEAALWEKVGSSMDEWDSIYGTHQVFVMGDKPVFADMVIASMVLNSKLTDGEESDGWKRVCSWNKGRVGRVIEEVLKYGKL